MKTDAEIKKQILEELKWQPDIDDTHIGVTVEDGIVTLYGVVADFQKKVAAQSATKKILGVKALADEIEVKYGDTFKKTDKEIAKAIANALESDSSVSKEEIQLTVDNGYVTLYGEVPWAYQKNAAEKIAQNILGVKNVMNNIALNAIIVPHNAEDQIIKALERSTLLNSKGLRVQVDGTTVQLKGRVHTLSEKEEAEQIAYKAPGVQKVQNDIVVQYFPDFL